MRLLDRKRIWIAGLALVLGVNAIALAGVAYNRNGTPDSTLRLSERELQQPYAWNQEGDDSGMALTLRWRTARRPRANRTALPFFDNDSRQPDWLTAAKLEALGFRLPTRLSSDDDPDRSREEPDREVLLVLEYDGPAYQAALAEARAWATEAPTDPGQKSEAEARQELLKRETTEASRLFVVDAGLDSAALRARYPDRSHYAIVHGIVRPQWSYEDSVWRLDGRIDRLSIDAINVPNDYRSFVHYAGSTITATEHPFVADVAFGKRFEPWLLDIRAP